MAEIASAFVSILPSAKGFGSKLDSQVGSDVAASGKKSGHIWGKVFGAVAGLAIGAKAISFIGDSLAEAREAQKVGAQTTAVLKSTGKAAGITAEQIGAMATRLSTFTGVDDEAIQSGENLLLTFTNIKNFVGGQFTGTFDSATATMVDMSAALGQDMKASATQLGKALNDPIKGVTALSRVGVTFTEQQKEQIKTLVESGKTTQAQQLILGELTKEFGGSAAAQATASDKARVALGNLKEQIGTALIPIVDQAANVFTTKFAPAISGFVAGVQSGKGAGGVLAAAFATVGSVLQTQVLPFLMMLWTQTQTQLIPALVALGQVVAANVLPVLVAIAPPLLALGKALLGQVIPAVSNLIGFLVQFQSVTVPVAAGVLAMVAVFKAYKVITGIITAATKAFALAQGILNVVLAANPIGLVVLALVGLGVALVVAYKKSETFRNIVDGAFSAVRGAIGDLVAKVGEFYDKWKGRFDAAVAIAKGLPGIIKAAFSGAGSMLLSIGSDIIQGLIDGIVSKFNDLKSKLQEVTGLIPDWKGPLSKDRVLLKPTGAAIMDGLIDGIDSRKGKLKQKLIDATKAMIDTLKGKLSSLKSEMASLASSVASAFTSDVFSGGIRELMGGLFGDVSNLKAVGVAFKKLVSLGVSKSFLSALFQSGNTKLILDLANDPALAASASSLFDERTSLSTSLGQSVGMNQFGDRIDAVRDEIKELRKDVQTTPRLIGSAVANALNGVAAGSRRLAVA